jgi:hypothetical protein
MFLAWIGLAFALTTIDDVAPLGPVIVIGGLGLLVILTLLGLIVAGVVWAHCPLVEASAPVTANGAAWTQSDDSAGWIF